MNFNRIKRANWVVAMAMLALPGTMLTSCSKETNPTEQVAPKGDKLAISVQGIRNAVPSGALKARAGSTALSANAKTYEVYEFSDVDMAISMDNKLPVKSANVATNKGKVASGAFAAATAESLEAIGDDVKYVVYLYDGQNFVSATELDANTEGTIEGLDLSKTYTWVALSYNDETAPTLNPADGSLVLPENTDVLYASDEVDMSVENPAIAITFDHVFSRIGIELNTIGVFGEISGTPAVSVSGLELTTGSINLLDGSLTPGATFTPTINYADFVNVDEAHDDAKIAYVYTAPTAAQTVQLTVQNLAISHADGNVARTFFTSPANFELDVTPLAGQSHHLLFNVIESALTTAHENVTVRWGRSNLYYTPGVDVSRQYRFYANNVQRSRADGYFSYQGLISGQFPSTTTQGDPCELVYPAGLWRQPTNADINSITTSNGVLGSLLGTIGSLLGARDPAPGSSVGTGTGGNYAQYSVTAGAPTSGENAFGDASSASNNLRFYYNGQITNVALLTDIGEEGSGLLGLGLSSLSADLLGFQIIGTNIPVLGTSYNQQAAFWTRSPVLDGGLLDLLGTSAGSWGYFGYTTRAAVLGVPFGDPFVKATSSIEALSNVDLLGINLLNTSFKNVRCVRN